MTNLIAKWRLILSGYLVVNDKKEVLWLYKTKYEHYKTPGGKIELNDCKNPEKPTKTDLTKTAKRELFEELGKDIKIKKLLYFGAVEFTIPDARLAAANKFITKITSGIPRINEPEIFSKIEYLPIEHLEKYPISPDLKLLLSKFAKFYD